jgi:hypothetical protein
MTMGPVQLLVDLFVVHPADLIAVGLVAAEEAALH